MECSDSRTTADMTDGWVELLSQLTMLMKCSNTVVSVMACFFLNYPDAEGV